MSGDEFGNRMKELEGREQVVAMPLLPLVVRLDGKNFSTFTRGLERPYDVRLSELMTNTAKYLARETNAHIAYTQSDEITLVLYSDNIKSQIYFDGRIFKICSILAAKCSLFFNKHLREAIPEKAHLDPVFDCRAWTVPNKMEAANAVLWREQDATKNSISMASQSFYSHKELMGKNGSDKQEMLFQKGINWNEYPDFFKRGVFIQKVKLKRPFSIAEIKSLPDRHEARRNPNLVVERTEFKEIAMPPFGKVVNRVEVVFDGETPMTVTTL